VNRHIERLVEAAPYTTISSEGRLFTQQNMAEFAEKLIKECADVCLEQRQYQTKEVYAQAVLSHFEVKLNLT
jgi:hypothetical protein